MKKLFLGLPILFLVACGPGEPELDYEPTEYDKKIDEFLEGKSYNPERTESGLYIHIDKAGSDEKPGLNDYLTLKYEGRLMDGSVFDGTEGQAITFPFPLSDLILGWQEGIPSFGKGGKGTLIIPPDLGYGDRDMPGLPANSILVFDIEIVDFSDQAPGPQVDMSVDYSPEIDAYIEEKGLENPTKTETGLYMFIEEEGGEEKPTVNSYLTLNYEGYLLNGNSFDGTGGTPTTFSFPVANLILGWQEGIPYLGRGGKAKFIIPPYLGYGDRDTPTIPANSILVFDIEIVDFTDTPPAQ